MTLDELEQGKKGVIEDLEISGMTLQRLISLVFTPGAELSVVRKAPLLDPFDISICGSLVAVRKDEAKKIIVKEV